MDQPGGPSGPPLPERKPIMVNSRIECHLADKAHSLLREAEDLPGDAGAKLPRQVGSLSLLAELLTEAAFTPNGVQQATSYLDQIEVWLRKELSNSRTDELPLGYPEQRRPN